MKNKILILLLILQFVLLLAYFMDDNWLTTRPLKATLGKFQESVLISEQSVTVFAQDEKSYIWIGTSNGLNIYTGNEYEQLFYDPSDSTTLPDNKIQSLLRDSKGQMWVGTPNGVAKHIGWFKFKRYNIPFTPHGAYQLADYGEKGILVNNGIDVYNIKGDSVTRFHHFNTFSECSNLIYPDRKGGFWTIQPTEVRHYDQICKRQCLL